MARPPRKGWPLISSLLKSCLTGPSKHSQTVCRVVVRQSSSFYAWQRIPFGGFRDLASRNRLVATSYDFVLSGVAGSTMPFHASWFTFFAVWQFGNGSALS